MAKCPKCEHDKFTSEGHGIGGVTLKLIVCEACNTVVGVSSKTQISELLREIKSLKSDISSLKSSVRRNS